MDPTSKPIILLGAPFSGASEVAAGLSERGFTIAEEIHAINRQAIAAFGMNAQLVDPLPEDWRHLPLAEQTIKRLGAALRSLDKEHLKWGLDDPATSLLLPLYKEAFDAESVQPRYVVCVTKPIGLARLRHADGDLEGAGLRSIGLWVYYTLNALRETRGKDRRVVPYKRFLSDRNAILDQIIASDDERLDEAELPVELAGLPPVVAKTHAFCLRAFQDPATLNNGGSDAELEALWTEFGGLCQMIRPTLIPEAPMMFFWKEGAQTKQQEQMFTPSGTWQSLGAQLPAPPKTMVQVAPYHMPCRVWIRRAAWRTAESEEPAELLPGPTGRLEDIGGFKLLTVFGPAPVLVQSPAVAPATLELEFYIQASEGVLTDVVTMLGERLSQTSRR